MSRCVRQPQTGRVGLLMHPEPREPQHRRQASDEWKRATDGNGCQWEWKFSLDEDRRPELSCRCRTCGVKYYLSSWQWTLDSGRDTKCLPPTGKRLSEASGIHKVGYCTNRGSRLASLKRGHSTYCARQFLRHMPLAARLGCPQTSPRALIADRAPWCLLRSPPRVRVAH